MITILLNWLKTCFISQYKVRFWKCSLCSWKAFKGKYSALVKYNVLYISIRSNQLIMLFKFPISLLICFWVFFGLFVVSIEEKFVLKFPTVIVDLSISPLHSINFCFIFWGYVIIGIYIFKLITFPVTYTFYCYEIFLIMVMLFNLSDYLSWCLFDCFLGMYWVPLLWYRYSSKSNLD